MLEQGPAGKQLQGVQQGSSARLSNRTLGAAGLSQLGLASPWGGKFQKDTFLVLGTSQGSLHPSHGSHAVSDGTTQLGGQRAGSPTHTQTWCSLSPALGTEPGLAPGTCGFEQTSGTGGSAHICSAWSRAGKKGEGSGLHCHSNFSEVFPSSAPLQGIAQSLPGCVMPVERGWPLNCVFGLSGPGSVVQGRPRALPCAGTCDKSQAGPAGPRGASQHEAA